MEDFLLLLITAAWLMIPAYIGNMVPILAARLRILKFMDKPVDGGRTFRGKPLFGSHKTIRGFFVGTIAAIGIIYLQAWLYGESSFVQRVSLLDYSSINLPLYGFLLGFGALFGDLVESFFKRQIGVASGKDWPVFDEIDLAVGALALLAIVYWPPWSVVITALVLSPALSFIFSRIGYLTGIKKRH